jgi:hypothetical protein
MKKLLICVLFLCVFAVSAWAQNGGKAEPSRIQFKKGAASANLSGAISGDAQAEYIFGAAQGQTITIKVTRGAAFEMFDPADVKVKESNNSVTFTLKATETGDYRLNVLRLAGAPRKLNYKLTVTIK